jgi:large subunit ribosomal protein L3
MDKQRRVVLLMGRKLGMTQLQDASARIVAVTAIEVTACPIVSTRTKERDGYCAIQVGADEVKADTLSGAELGHCTARGHKPMRRLRELRVSSPDAYAPGETFGVESFAVGEWVDVSAITKGRGFQGVMKRHGFSGGPASHGSMFHRRGGSYGQREEPGRIYRGRKMPGHMGAERRTMQNLAIVRIVPEKGLLFVRGSVAGPNGNWVSIRSAKKR